MRRLLGFLVLTLASVVFMLAPSHIPSSAVGVPDFVHFESGHVRPATLTPDGQRLLVVNTADGRLSVFDLTGEAPARVAEIPVGLEPISVACLDDHTAWVVNHLSDDVSVVDLDARHVRATLWVGDEPADVVFAGSPVRAYVSVSQEDAVKVYDPASLGAPVAVVPINGRLPRALARSADGANVYAAVLTAGNRTSTVPFDAIPEGSMPIDPQFPRSPSLPADPPNVALIVQQQGSQWRDMYGNDWSAQMPFSMHEVDVAEISTASASVTRTFGDLGTVNFAVAVSPLDGRIAVAATEALNLLRFQNRLRGRTVDTRLGLVTAAGSKSLINLNPHINYAVTPGPASERDSSLGVPTGIAFAPDGQRLYLTSLASNRVAVVDPDGAGVVARVPTVAGPTGVVVDQARDRIYVVGRFRNQLQTHSATSLAPVAVASIGFDPTPDAIVNGRRFFYGGFTSGHGDQACASCHVFGDFDALAWDLGEPNGVVSHVPPGTPFPGEGFDPMKGPMVTQTLRGLPGAGRMHWRADRTNLTEFNQTFRDLLGRTSMLPDTELAAFSSFVLPLSHPPNPNRYLDGTLRDAPVGQPSAKRGEFLFLNAKVFDRSNVTRCNTCHQGPALTSGVLVSGNTFGDQDVKTATLRVLYRKVGMSREPGAVSKRGFGFSHDGGFASIEKFLESPIFTIGLGTIATNKRRDFEAFLLSMGSGLATAVGRQVSFDSPSGTPATAALLDTLKGQSASCDLIAKGRIAGTPRGWLYLGGDQWRPDRAAGISFSTAEILALAGPGSEVTFTAIPPGTGTRMGIDRDRDTFLDADEVAGGSDPGDPASTPALVGVDPLPVGSGLRSVGPNPFRQATEVQFVLAEPGAVSLSIHDVLGREVRAVAKGLWLEAGPQSLRWDGRRSDGKGVAAGVYFVRLSAEGRDWVRAVVRIR